MNRVLYARFSRILYAFWNMPVPPEKYFASTRSIFLLSD